MQIDMHYYGTYALARMSGFTAADAMTVATAAQFVDESVTAEPVNMNGQSFLLPVISAHTMFELRKNSNAMDQWRVWVPFHFLPGGKGNRVSEKLVCLWGEKDNLAVESIIRLALEHKGEPYGLHLLGVVTHVLQDTYAHYGFSGIASDLNRIDQTSLTALNSGDLAKYIKSKYRTFMGRFMGAVAEETRLGHASVATYPDRPYLQWEFEYEDRPAINAGYDLEKRNNQESFYLACTRLHALYSAYLDGADEIPSDDGHLGFSPEQETDIKKILAEVAKKEDRCDAWIDAIGSPSLFEPVPEDQRSEVEYDDEGWEAESLHGRVGGASTDAYKFSVAAGVFLNEVHDTILKELGVLV